METPLYNQKGENIGSYELPNRIFDVLFHPSTVHQVLRIHDANARESVAHTKIRKEVRGGGKKPWRQKGTGRARHGSIRSPLWKGGGVTFGPRNEKIFALKVNKKQKQKALFMVLSSKIKDKQLAVLDSLNINEVKTKTAFDILYMVKKSAFNNEEQRKTLVILSATDKNTVLSMRNIPYVKTILADSLNVRDLLVYRYVIMPRDAVEVIDKTYIKTK